jgi:hypothetical protein
MTLLTHHLITPRSFLSPAWSASGDGEGSAIITTPPLINADITTPPLIIRRRRRLSHEKRFEVSVAERGEIERRVGVLGAQWSPPAHLG